MALNVSDRVKARRQRRQRVRKKIFGTALKPRLSVFRSHKHIYAQLIDDVGGKTLLSASSLSEEVKGRGKNKKGSDRKMAELVGSVLATKAVNLNIKDVVFDRNGYLFHGRVKALADAARQGGLQF
jgi:large subunit ribosomal protein L18